jgi:hypothetical protein
MDWIKKNYEKLLLGVFGLFALAVGGLIAAENLGGSEDESKKVATEGSALGTDKKAETEQALTELAANVGKPVWNELIIAPHRTAHLFTASPQVRKAGVDNVLQLLDPATTELREGIPNWWLYENGIDLTRDDTASRDDDGDKFTNLEEFQGGSNPRDPESRPGFFAKLSLEEVVEVPYEIKNRAVEGADISLSRTKPVAGLTPDGRAAKISSLQYHVGDVLFGDDSRFKVKAVDSREKEVKGQRQMVAHVILIDTKNADKEIVIAVGDSVNLPTYEAKIKNNLSGKEDVYKIGEEFSFPEFPGVKINIEKIIPADPNDPKNPGIVEIKYSEPGKPPAKTQLQLKK